VVKEAPLRRDIGHHHPFPPEPIVAEDTRYVDAGAVRIGVEFRRIEGLADRLRATYTGTPFEAVFEEWRKNRTAARHRTPTETAGMAALGGGVSLHVIGADSLDRAGNLVNRKFRTADGRGGNHGDLRNLGADGKRDGP